MSWFFKGAKNEDLTNPNSQRHEASQSSLNSSSDYIQPYVDTHSKRVTSTVQPVQKTKRNPNLRYVPIETDVGLTSVEPGNNTNAGTQTQAVQHTQSNNQYIGAPTPTHTHTHAHTQTQLVPDAGYSVTNHAQPSNTIALSPEALDRKWIFEEMMRRLDVASTPIYKFLTMVAASMGEPNIGNLIVGGNSNGFRQFANPSTMSGHQFHATAQMLNWITTHQIMGNVLDPQLIRSILTEITVTIKDRSKRLQYLMEELVSEVEKMDTSSVNMGDASFQQQNQFQRKLAWQELPEHLGMILPSPAVRGAIGIAYGNIRTLGRKPHFKLADLMFQDTISAQFAQYVASLMQRPQGRRVYVNRMQTDHVLNKREQGLAFFMLVDYGADGKLRPMRSVVQRDYKHQMFLRDSLYVPPEPLVYI